MAIRRYEIARGTLFVFLIAVLVALAITLDSVPSSVKLLAVVAVTPIVALTLFFLSYEHKMRPWSFIGSAFLGAAGVALRLVINTQPSLEVGGGLPVTVTASYIALGFAVMATSFWSYVSLRGSARQVPV